VIRKLTALGCVVLISVVACSRQQSSSPVVTGGSVALGRKAIARYGCGSCHLIPGVKGARGLAAPPLIHFSKRTFIAGELANTPSNLERWVQHPKDVEPGTDMPELGVTPDDARNIAAFLEHIP